MGAVLAAVVAVAACGDDDSGSSGGTAAPGSTAGSVASTAGAATTSAAEGGSTTLAAASGDATGQITFSTSNPAKQDVDRTGETISIGLSNNEGAAFSIPEFRIGGEVAVDYINSTGGVNGAKIELHECLADGSPEASIKCANDFVEKKVDLATYGIDVGGSAAVPIYAQAGIPWAVPTTYGATQENDPNSYGILTAIETYQATVPRMFKELGVKKLAYLTEDSGQAAHDAAAYLETYAKKAGLEFYVNYINPASPDYAAALSSAIAAGADGVHAFLSEPGCAQTASAGKQLNFTGPLVLGVCSSYLDEVGDDAVGTYTMRALFAPSFSALAPPQIQKNLEAYAEQMKNANQSQYIEGNALQTFATIMDLKTIMETIPEGTAIDAISIKKALDNAKGLPGFAGTDVNCRSNLWPGNPSTCRAEVLMLKVVKGADGKPTYEAVKKDDSGFSNDSQLAR